MNVRMNKAASGFTLMEMIITIVIIGVMTAFALPNYFKALEHQKERDAAVQLQTLHAAAALYHAQNRRVYPAGILSVSAVNSIFNTNITPDAGSTFEYNGAAGGGTYTAVFRWTTGGVGKTARINQDSLASNNPCCLTGNCLSLPDCP
jgi:prepilin-type N-terminal cleavage/methylation domain-containing protein